MKPVFFIILLGAFAAAYPNFLAATSLTTNAGALPAANAAELYEKQCASCHGKDGRAKTIKGKFKHARNLTDAEWQEKVSDERIFNSITNGKEKMPAFGKKLSQEQIEVLVTYVRAFKK
ncbi:MAG TPA: cytochrome c [Pyrinomonadaceae bacterium]|nr:cytochrome c [Pyrinomonadaceae bacterium]